MLVYESPAGDGIDPAGGLQYSRYDRTRVESVFKEATRKEKSMQAPPSTNFQMNLVNGNMKGSLVSLKHSHNPNMIIAEKVHARTPMDRSTTPPGPRTAADEYGNKMIRHMEKPPWQKVDLPQSASQEIGWMIAQSAQYNQIMAQRAQSTSANAVGKARKEAYRSASLTDESGGQLHADGTHTGKAAMMKSRSDPSLPCLIPHLPSENLPRGAGMRAEARMLNNTRFRRPKSTCDLTNYADKYYAVMRHSPFNQAAARGGDVDRTSRD